jgi:hypothetical protein
MMKTEVPDRYDEDEILIISGSFADKMMKSFGGFAWISEDEYDRVRNLVACMCELEIENWNAKGSGLATINPLPVDLFVEMERAAMDIIVTSMGIVSLEEIQEGRFQISY